MKNAITVKVLINKDIETVWEKFTNPLDIEKWYFASEDWHTPRAENNLAVGGAFMYRMEAKDGSFGFDLKGLYTEIQHFKNIHFNLEDGRKVNVSFEATEKGVMVTEIFEPESENPLEMQQNSWQAILDNFKKYVEKH
jgi:uncharacterized protein YndB with AHSA1/START domain